VKPKQAQMKKMVSPNIPGYTYGSGDAASSPISVRDLERLRQSVDFTDEDQRYLRLAGEVLADQTEELVNKWRGVISRTPHLAQYSLRPDGKPDAHYSSNSGLRFQRSRRVGPVCPSPRCHCIHRSHQRRGEAILSCPGSQ
jgi:hypothetical protein